MHVNKLGRSFPAACAAVVLLCLLASCGGGGGTPPASSSPTPAASTAPGCKDISALESSLKTLEGVDVRKDGVSALTAAVSAVAVDLGAVVTSASSTLQPHVDQVKTAFTALKTSLTGLTAGNLRAESTFHQGGTHPGRERDHCPRLGCHSQLPLWLTSKAPPRPGDPRAVSPRAR